MKRKTKIFRNLTILLVIGLIILSITLWTTVINYSYNREQRIKYVQDKKGELIKYVHELKEKAILGADYSLNLPGNYVLDLMWIEPGEFIMGSPKDEKGRIKIKSWESQHKVKITKGYWLGKYEVTHGQWGSILINNPLGIPELGENTPIENVNWYDTIKFCQKLNEFAENSIPEGYEYGLPTEAQWEFACRAGTTSTFNTGFDEDALNKSAWWFGNSDHKRHTVGQKQPNNWGLYDMHGSVDEWCYDWFSEFTEESVDPAGDWSGNWRVMRGGGWYYPAKYCRSASRNSSAPGYSMDAFGLRLALRPIIKEITQEKN